MRDEDLDRILAPLRDLKPTARQIGRWQRVASRTHPSPLVYKLLPLVAAGLIGFLIGQYAKTDMANQSAEINFSDGATIELVYTKSE